MSQKNKLIEIINFVNLELNSLKLENLFYLFP